MSNTDPKPGTHANAPAKAVFADGAARAELAECLDVLADPADHEATGANGMVRVKQNPSRTVWRWRRESAGQPARGYYLKVYHRQGLARRVRDALVGSDAIRELRFSRLLAEAGVPAIEVLAAGRSAGGAWMVSREVEPATPADTWHKQRCESGEPRDRAAVRQASLQLAEMVARMHEAGILHRDLHVGNVLVQEGPRGPRLLLTDLHRMSRRRRLSRRACAKNLGLLLHGRRHVTTRTERLAFLKRYLALRGCGGTLRGWNILVEHFAERWSRKVCRVRDRRAFGRNKYFTPLAMPGGWRGHAILSCRRRPRFSAAAALQFTEGDWRKAMEDPERLFDAADATVVKDSPSSLVVRRSLVVGGRVLDVHLKRTRRKGWHKFLLDALRRSRARRAFGAGHALITRRIATALPLATLDRRAGPFLFDSILITETVAPADHLGRFLHRWLGEMAGQRVGLNAARQQQLAREMLRQLGRLLQRLQSEGFAHRDLKASNLLVHWTQDAPPDMVMVDLDGLSRHRRVSTRRMFQALMRLNVSLLESPAVNHAGRLRMLMGYLRRPSSGRINFKPYWRELEAWSARKLKRQINSRRKRQKKMRR